MTSSPSTTASTTETSTLVADKSINNDSNNVMSTSTIVIIVLGAICALLVGAVVAMIVRTRDQSSNSTPTTQRPSIERIVNTEHNPVYDPHFAGDEPPANYYQDLPSSARTNISLDPDYLDVHPDDSLTNGNTDL